MARYDIGVRINHVFLLYTTIGTEGDEAYELVYDSTVWLVRLDASVETVEKCVTENETRVGNREKLYAERYGRLLFLEVEHLSKTCTGLCEVLKWIKTRISTGLEHLENGASAVE